jgi:hypothetical protein
LINMDNSERKKELKIIGLYVVVILTILRFIVYPLHGAVAAKKNAFNEYYDSYVLKHRLLERSKIEQKIKPAVDKKPLIHNFYSKDLRFSNIQADVIEALIKLAEKKGAVVLDFEMLEPVAGKNVSEVPVLIRLEGKAPDCIDILKSIEQNDKVLWVKSLEINRTSGQNLRYYLTITAFRVEK